MHKLPMKSPQRAHILVVEDDLDTRESMIDLLQQDGYSVSAAADGGAALAYLGTCRRAPNLILLDLHMPGMDGFEFRRAQLNDAKHAAIPVAVVSASPPMQPKMQALRPAAYFLKPVNVKSLRARIRSVLRRSGHEAG